jgi:hypothetical protein
MTNALPPGRSLHRRALFGFVDADGWGYAFIKATFWLLVIIVTLGYIPDRAYYFIVSRTLDIVGTPGISVVNLCPPENGPTVPCPVPAGGVLPWQTSPAAINLPAARTGGVVAQVGKQLLYIGGSDGKAPTSNVYLTTSANGTFDAWSDGPALPAARTSAALANLNGTAFLIGGTGPDGKATDTVWSLGLDTDTGKLGTWQDQSDLKLPAPRAGAAAIAVPDGIVVLGGKDANGKVSTTVWKSTIDTTSGKLGAWKEEAGLPHAVSGASIAFVGTFLWVYGGSDDAGATNIVQRADYGDLPAAPAASGAAGSAAPAASPAASAAAPPQGVVKWAVASDATAATFNLPAPRTGAAGFVSNGALYLAGGSDGTAAHTEMYWAIPDNNGNLTGGWSHLDATDLPAAITDAAPIVTGGNAVLIGGTTSAGPVASSTRASLAPGAPFFQLGLIGVVVPGLQIGGQIGTQLGLLAAAGVGTGNFVLLCALGWAFNHRAQISAWRDRRRREKAAKAPAES